MMWQRKEEGCWEKEKTVRKSWGTFFLIQYSNVVFSKAKLLVAINIMTFFQFKRSTKISNMSEFFLFGFFWDLNWFFWNLVFSLWLWFVTGIGQCCLVPGIHFFNNYVSTFKSYTVINLKDKLVGLKNSCGYFKINVFREQISNCSAQTFVILNLILNASIMR